MSLLTKYHYTMCVVMLYFTIMLVNGFCSTEKYWAVIVVVAVGHWIYSWLEAKRHRNDYALRLIGKRY